MSSDFAVLDDETKAVCAAWFGMMEPNVGRLSFGMKEHRPSVRAQAALDRLVASGVVSRVDFPNGSVVYTPLQDCRTLLPWFMSNGDDEQFRFPLTEKITEDAKPGFRMVVSVPRNDPAARMALEIAAESTEGVTLVQKQRH